MTAAASHVDSTAVLLWAWEVLEKWTGQLQFQCNHHMYGCHFHLSIYFAHILYYFQWMLPTVMEKGSLGKYTPKQSCTMYIHLLSVCHEPMQYTYDKIGRTYVHLLRHGYMLWTSLFFNKHLVFLIVEGFWISIAPVKIRIWNLEVMDN